MDFDLQNVPEWNDEGMKVMEEKVLITYLRKQLQEMMVILVSIVEAMTDWAQEKQRNLSEAVTELYNYSVISPGFSELKFGECFLPYHQNSLEMTEKTKVHFG